MNRSTRNLILAAIAVGVIVTIITARNTRTSGNATPAAGGEQINWLTELEPALAQAKETGNPVMVDFFATWCPPCKMLDEQTYVDSRVIERSKKWVMVRIDVDKNKDLAQQYGIRSIPTIVVLQDGKETSRHTGFMGPGPMLSTMERTSGGP